MSLLGGNQIAASIHPWNGSPMMTEASQTEDFSAKTTESLPESPAHNISSPSQHFNLAGFAAAAGKQRWQSYFLLHRPTSFKNIFPFYRREDRGPHSGR